MVKKLLMAAISEKILSPLILGFSCNFLETHSSPSKVLVIWMMSQSPDALQMKKKVMTVSWVGGVSDSIGDDNGMEAVAGLHSEG